MTWAASENSSKGLFTAWSELSDLIATLDHWLASNWCWAEGWLGEGGHLHFVTIFSFSDGNSFKYAELGAMEEDSLASIQTLDNVRQSQSKLSSFNTFNTDFNPRNITATALHKIANMAKCKESVPTPSPIKTLDPIQILHCVNIWMVAILNFGLFTFPLYHVTLSAIIGAGPGPPTPVKMRWPGKCSSGRGPGGRRSSAPASPVNSGSLVIHYKLVQFN